VAKSPEIMTVAEATKQHPRHAGCAFLERKDGSILLAWMEIAKNPLDQPAGDDAPSDIVSLVSRDVGRTWGDFRPLVRRGPDDTAAYCPSFLRMQDGRLLFRYEMFHHFVKGEEKCISAFACVSDDEGETFSKPVPIYSRSAHHALSSNDDRQLSTGRLVVPACYMEGKALENDGKGLAPTDISYAGSFYSDDLGRSWQECENYIFLPMRGTMEPKIEELRDGRILVVMRTQLGSIFKSYSEDGGRTWSRAQTTSLKSPESCPLLLRNPRNDDLLIAWNDSPYDPKFDHYGLRNPLSIAKSSDEGETWQKLKDIETDPEWEYTNPGAIISSEGTLLLGYEASKYERLAPPGKLGRSRMHMKLARIDLGWLYS
jgi:sialidase-1